MTELELDKEQKKIANKMLGLIQKDCGCPRNIEKLRIMDEALTALNRASYYIMKVSPVEPVVPVEEVPAEQI